MCAFKDEEMVPCTWCGKPTRSLGTKQCDACWERNRHGTIPYDTLLAERDALANAARDALESFDRYIQPMHVGTHFVGFTDLRAALAKLKGA